jgi:hypothetical protein
MTWVVSFPILGPFGPRRATAPFNSWWVVVCCSLDTVAWVARSEFGPLRVDVHTGRLPRVGEARESSSRGAEAGRFVAASLLVVAAAAS